MPGEATNSKHVLCPKQHSERAKEYKDPVWLGQQDGDLHHRPGIQYVVKACKIAGSERFGCVAHGLHNLIALEGISKGPDVQTIYL